MTDYYQETCLRGEEIDLDNLDIYPDKWKEMNIFDLFLEAWKDAGMSLFYMKYLWPDMMWQDQSHRVAVLCDELIKIHREGKIDGDTPENRLKLMKWMYRFVDEVENQC
ncbi:hypothetical protein LCGC14_1537790 [marine sediment metagenome]|uniref:Uncharacterized protein n=1 Tax=marine sediment metagenome TaxID=412755 RepID=A0A0F9LUU1_9ZZZZ